MKRHLPSILFFLIIVSFPSFALSDYGYDRSFDQQRQTILNDESRPYKDRLEDSIALHDRMYGDNDPSPSAMCWGIIILIVVAAFVLVYTKHNKTIAEFQKKYGNRNKN